MNVGEVYDGDTVRFWVSLGLDEYGWKDIRLADVRAPEIRSSDPLEKAQGMASQAYLASLLPLGSMVRVRTEKVEGAPEVLTFTRYVGWLTRPDGLDVNAEMTRWLAEMGYTGGS